MSGKQQFNDAVVINGAMKVFWRRGFEAASIDELASAMGLSRSSLYNRFGDKEGLYNEVLAIYNDRVLRRMALVEGETQRAKIEALLLEFIPNAVETDKPSGCMLVRACTEIANLPPSGKVIALDATERQREFIRGILNHAVANGELNSAADVEALVWHFLGVLQAIMNLPQIGATADDLRRMVASAMRAWPRVV